MRSRARIGHTHLTHSFLITKEPAPLCDACNVDLSIDHIVTRCPKYAVARKIFKDSSSLRLALSEENTEAIYNFFYFKHLNNKL
ncbi:putative RNA-directed DNA polymerase [Aphis craccivora]|uniref:Putative RNA-directed DNA polymerase n=1 Tax=Aphis craccivora TaxID=307492 RepID=A0A6G0YX93_APHCR|nr:putative RNA-directed DNA polymerase [Aphis craccivora]